LSVIAINLSLLNRKGNSLYCSNCHTYFKLFETVLTKKGRNVKYYCLDCVVQLSSFYPLIIVRGGKCYLPISKSIKYLYKLLCIYLPKRNLQKLLGYSSSHNMINAVLRGEVKHLSVERLKLLSEVALEFLGRYPTVNIVRKGDKFYCSCCGERIYTKEFDFILKTSKGKRHYCINCAPRVFKNSRSKCRDFYVPLNDTVIKVFNELQEYYSNKQLLKMLGFSRKYHFFGKFKAGRIRNISINKLKTLNELYKEVTGG